MKDLLQKLGSKRDLFQKESKRDLFFIEPVEEKNIEYKTGTNRRNS